MGLAQIKLEITPNDERSNMKTLQVARPPRNFSLVIWTKAQQEAIVIVIMKKRARGYHKRHVQKLDVG
jgi:hypothetical protein